MICAQSWSIVNFTEEIADVSEIIAVPKFADAKYDPKDFTVGGVNNSFAITKKQYTDDARTAIEMCIRDRLRDILLTVVGTAIYALGVYIFTAPNQIAPGGVSGLATVINFLTGAPIGLVTAAINLPLLILGWIYLGKTFILKTMISVLSFALIYDHVYCYLPSYSGSTLLAAVFGGVDVYKRQM